MLESNKQKLTIIKQTLCPNFDFNSFTVSLWDREKRYYMKIVWSYVFLWRFQYFSKKGAYQNIQTIDKNKPQKKRIEIG